ncbi:hypothetical protein B7P43_G07522 [Cryptotermes secundus]|uniref:Mitochondrial import receptor subunit TOM22 homolog n=1 Tax=Cryptotermes secundus TaxID=105785 RepID=A0A2J7QXM3_9NEOP|nr:hypothetical protein B7P43_G07522 [Cryptotermes secundus]
MSTNVCFLFVFQDLDETLSERLWGLTEMFPEGVRNITSAVVSSTCTGIKGFYGLSRIIAWCFFSSSAILFAPLIFEMERAQVEEMQRSQQKQVNTQHIHFIMNYIILKPWYGNGGGTLSTEYLEKICIVCV